MSVYVSELQVSLRNKKWRHSHHAYLMADTVEELHLFADRIGLKRSWFQPKSYPHYDLTANKRIQAIKAGALTDSARNMIKRCKQCEL